MLGKIEFWKSSKFPENPINQECKGGKPISSPPMSTSKRGAREADIDDLAEWPKKSVMVTIIHITCDNLTCTQCLLLNAMLPSWRDSTRNISLKPTLPTLSVVWMAPYIALSFNWPMVDLQCNTWHSEAYSHFIMPPTIMMMDSGEIGYKLTCKRCVIVSSILCVHMLLIHSYLLVIHWSTSL